MNERASAKQEPVLLSQPLYDFYSQYYAPSRVVLVGRSDFIATAIREAQRAFTPDKKPSLWSHTFLFGDLRHDGRHLNPSDHSPYIYESDLQLHVARPELRNGVQESWIGKWSGVDIEHAAVIETTLSAAEAEQLLAIARRTADEQILYPIAELIGTWFRIVTRRRWEANPLDDDHAMFCSAFVRYCYSAIGHDFPIKAHPSNTAPEDLYQACKVLGLTIHTWANPTPFQIDADSPVRTE